MEDTKRRHDALQPLSRQRLRLWLCSGSLRQRQTKAHPYYSGFEVPGRVRICFNLLADPVVLTAVPIE